MAYLRTPDVYLYLRSLHKPTLKSRNATSVLSTFMGTNGDVTLHNIIKGVFKVLKFELLMVLVDDTQPTCTPFRINGIESQKDRSGLNKIHKFDNAFTSLNKVWLTFIIRLVMSLSVDPSS